mmetsp:Transcript_54147/g.131396  ORF Transcript_54147/g.131396 Transcript_54147/m.131396 type:complete len:379 (+) Transcript_54147:178-1314(+)|eukprot:CAMPEP_0113501022 /NCGR_PEP_ID=MMETSP0014_2-20120614/32696_1 /TAXON_ID=2857 /ORGANISM="Nitzschia sp." /LENGTH=378 /DNA_ID=CAMNT_0000395509 /DNA_START=94 /DNA_END=1230 /DNA_ORIENTATION=+ /assembly_acc=CAM_ASM_000159
MPATTTISSSTATNPATTALTTSSDPQQQQQQEAATTTTTSTRRTKNTTCYLPVVYGSIAYYLGKKKSDEYNTHEWTLFVRGPNQEDLSPVISKVVFQLHPSFAQPTRELTEPPYEVTERGWGEFEAQIRIHWKDTAQEQSTVVNHTIRLYPPGTPPNMTQSNKTSQTLEKPVLAEIYDEVVFTNPTEDFYQSLQQIDQLPKIELVSANATTTEEASSSANRNSQLKKEHVEYYNDEDDFLALVAAQKFLKDELSKVKRRFENVTGETTSADRSITTTAKAAAIQQSQQRARDAAAQAQQQAAAAAAAGSGGSGGKSSGGGSGAGGTSSKKRPSSTSKSGGGKKASSKKAKTTSSSSSNAAAAGTSNAATTSNTKSGK